PVAEETAGPLPVVLSGLDEAALREQAARWASWLTTHHDVALADVAVTAARHRTHFEQRASVVATDTPELVQALEALADGRPHPALTHGTATQGESAVLFTGQGSQRIGMGRRLHAALPVFRDAFDETCAALDPHLSRPLAEVVLAAEDSADATLVHETEFTQPALFAFEVALFRQWQSWGLRPAVVAGHSIGELTAAHVAGVLDLADAARLVAARGRLMQACERGGAMASVEAPEAEVTEVLAGIDGRISIAGLNGPAQTVVSGDGTAVEAVTAHFAGQGRRTRRLEVSHAFHSPHMDAMLAEFRAVAESCRFQAPAVPLVSSVTGLRADEDLTAGEGVRCPLYWVRQARDAVRFLDVVRAVEQQGVTRFLECGPAAVLSAMGAACSERDGVFVASQRPDAGESGGTDEIRTLVQALGALHVAGEELAWQDILPADSGAAPLALPTYAFQRERHWLRTAGQVSGDLASVGLEHPGHPWLGAATVLADGEGHLFTGKLSPDEHPWLRDHVVHDIALVPGTGLLELALTAAHRTGAAGVAELTLLEPLVLDEAVRLQVVVGAPRDDGGRTIGIHSRTENSAHDTWRRHAVGELLEHSQQTGEPQPQQWPAPDAERVELDDYYRDFHTLGLHYGPAFQGLAELWRTGDTLYAEVRLPDDLPTADYGVHPALLDAALHGLAALRAQDAPQGAGVLLPFAWSGVECRVAGSTALRVRVDLDRTNATASLHATDAAGRLVLKVAALRLREATAEQLRVRKTVEHLYSVAFQPLRHPKPADGHIRTWVVGGTADLADRLGGTGRASAPVRHCPDTDTLTALLDTGEEPPARIVVDARALDGEEGYASALAAVTGTLRTARSLLADQRLASTELVWVTRDSVAASPADPLDGWAGAPVWGLVRAARAEHPERTVRLVDLDAQDLHADVLARALAAADEPETAVRAGEVLASRLVPEPTVDETDTARRLDPDGSVLLTGGTGELGRRLARHLVHTHGVRHLVLTSRRGADAPGADELARDLTDAGAETVRIEACDAADRDQLAAVLATVAPQHPLTGVFHLAGVTDDGLLADQDEDRLRRVMDPKAAGALHLADLTAGLDLSALVLFSSVSGVLGSPGQSTYAAANAWLDALAARLRRQGRPAVALSWGMWEQSGDGMTARLGRADLARIRRQGIGPLTERQGLHALDQALAGDRAQLVPVRLELAAVQREADRGEDIHPLLRGLLRTTSRRTPSRSGSGVRDRLAALPPEERLSTLLALVRQEAAAVLGRTGQDGIGEQQVFQQLGMDSMTAVELRRRLIAVTGVRLPSTLAFDYPTPAAVAGLLLDRMELTPAAAPAAGRPTRAADAAEPIAVVSMACRLPGGIDTPEAFWALLAEERDGIGPFPQRWDALDVYDPDREAVGKSYIRQGGFLAGAEDFDAGFFGISPREAVSMDPQQRLVL
ncbi:SDR family NAD(P)-dependent oxidoreductase, partial [Streptomyces sp. AHA2]|uniref:SDR family NAD(P)-dependent oxidoreductase n=1 Tax=Streptomyces sp. AHA2 TaxID=3064526 RepID=UPI002FE3F3F1